MTSKGTYRGVGLIAALGLLIVGCSASQSASPQSTRQPPATAANPTSSTQGSAASASLAGLLPADLRAKGTLVIGSEIDYPPMESYPPNSTTPVGFDIDLGNAMANDLGLKAQWVNAEFNGILAGLDAGRWDIVMSSMTDTTAREQSADFIDYFAGAVGLVVKTGNPLHVDSLESLCGKTLGIITGAGPSVLVDNASKKCTENGKAPINQESFQTTNSQFLALQTGRVPIIWLGATTADYHVAKNPDIFQVGAIVPMQDSFEGIAVKKGNTQLQTVIKTALQRLIDNGTYDKIAQKWNVRNLTKDFKEIKINVCAPSAHTPPNC